MVSHDCPPSKGTPFSPRALFTPDLTGTRAPREGRGGRFIALERLGYYLRTALREFILSFAYAKFEIPVCNASSRVILDDNFNFVETFRDCGDLAIVEESGK